MKKVMGFVSNDRNKEVKPFLIQAKNHYTAVITNVSNMAKYNPEIWFHRAMANYMLGHIEEAINDTKRSNKIYPDEKYKDFLQRLNIELGNRKLQEVNSEIDRQGKASALVIKQSKLLIMLGNLQEVDIKELTKIVSDNSVDKADRLKAEKLVAYLKKKNTAAVRDEKGNDVEGKV